MSSLLLLLLLLFFIRPISATTLCPDSSFTCGNLTLDIRYPFFTNTKCRGVYLIQCLNLTPMIQLPGQEFMYPVFNISYSEETLVIHDLKLSLGPYSWGLNCFFLYDFRVPISHINVTQISQLVSSGGPFFKCRDKDNNDLSPDIFAKVYGKNCKDYSIYYTDEMDSREGIPPESCTTSGNLLFEWKLSFRDTRNFSLLSAGFSRNWVLQPDCFACHISGPGCGSGDTPACRCSEDCPGSKTNGINSGKKKKQNIIIIATIVATAGLILACALCYLWCRPKNKQHDHPLPSTPLIRTPSEPSSFKKIKPLNKMDSIDFPTHVFPYSELRDATNGFDASRELGDGGFGTVYKGELSDGRTVAVKRLYDNNCKRVEQFINEVAILSCLRNNNLVTFYGCTSHHSPELLLVYEYVSNGTVADHLHGLRTGEQALTWPRRLSIAIETATALAYLHAVEPPIIHRDVKTNNILLDDSFHVKVADFGLSRLFPMDATHVSTAPQGTPGYLDPEYHQCYQLTDKSDVYSFGVVLVELISSKEAVDITRDRYEINLASMALNKIRNKELEQLVDPLLGYQSDSEMRRMITLVAEVAFRCLQVDKDMRPPIKEVLHELKGIERSHQDPFLNCPGDVNGYCKGDQKALEIDVPHVRLHAGNGAVLLKNSEPSHSPNSVMEKWVSSASMLSTSSGYLGTA